MAILPGNLSERMVELREQRKLTQEALSKELDRAGFGYFDRTTISRAESGETRRVSSEMLMALASYYGVSIDFLCGLTENPEKKDYELKELGLSYEAARKLLLREVDPDAINRLMECDSFPLLCKIIATSFSSDMAETYHDIDQTITFLHEMVAKSSEFGYELNPLQKEMIDIEIDDKYPDVIEREIAKLKKQFALTAEELTAFIDGSKQEPAEMDPVGNFSVREFKKEVLIQKHTANIRMLSEKEVFDIISEMAIRKGDFLPDEAELFKQLFWLMIQNRKKKVCT